MDRTSIGGKRIICVLVVGLLLCLLNGPVSGQLTALDFGNYYEPFALDIEPNAPGYALPLAMGKIDIADNMNRVFDVAALSDLIEQSGFAVVPGTATAWQTESGDDITDACKFISDYDIPLFVTTDTVLHLYHIQFDETLKDIEEREFVADIEALTESLFAEAIELHGRLDGDLKEAAQRNVAYLAVARKLMNPDATIPAIVQEPVTAELARINAHEGFDYSDIFIYKEDYSQYVPRGHYTRSEPLQRYFRTLMWYGRMAFLLKGAENWGPLGDALISTYDAKIQTLQAMLLAISLRDIPVGDRTGLGIWDRLYTVTAFYVGLADDLTPYDYLWALNQVFSVNFTLEDLADEGNLFALKLELATLPSPRIYGGTGGIVIVPPVTPETLDDALDKTKGMRLMGQRFIPDSYMFQNLVYPAVTGYTGSWQTQPFSLTYDGIRGYPLGLDVMALLGSREALHILLDQGDTDYAGYWRQFGKLKDEFDGVSETEWNVNLYWSWLYSLKALLEDLPVGYPNFMRTDAWQRRSLNAALASWAELRHDTILYAKQSYTFERGVTKPIAGYVEPVPEFYGRLLALARMTRTGLSDMQVMSEEAINRMVALEAVLQRLLEMSVKELLNEPLSEAELAYIEGFAPALEELVFGVDEIGLKTTLVADVHTEGQEKMVVEEGVGRVDFIITACPAPDGSVFLAAGPVLSYYEFKHPMDDRLTDEAWRQMLDSGQAPDRPQWYVPLLKMDKVGSR